MRQSNTDITLDYDARIDKRRSSVGLIGPNGKKIPLHRQPGPKPNQLKMIAQNLAPGTYHIEWQALAGDGHIIRGEVTFTVRRKPLSGSSSNRCVNANQ